MFEVGFTEIILILGLALVVLGPEKLPGLAQKVGRWTGRARSMARQLHAQLEHEVTLDELSKTKPMQAGTPEASPSTSTGSAPVAEPPPPTGFDLDQHFEELETTPERMHAKAAAAEATSDAGTSSPAEVDPTRQTSHTTTQVPS